jgi:hypothetical protein
MILHFYIKDPEIVAATFPNGMTPENIGTLAAKADEMEPNQIFDVVRKSLQMLEKRVSKLDSEIYEYLAPIRRSDERLKQIPQ